MCLSPAISSNEISSCVYLLWHCAQEIRVSTTNFIDRLHVTARNKFYCAFFLQHCAQQISSCIHLLQNCARWNTPFPKCKIFVVKMSFIRMRIKNIFIEKASLWNRGLWQLGIGLFRLMSTFCDILHKQFVCLLPSWILRLTNLIMYLPFVTLRAKNFIVYPAFATLRTRNLHRMSAFYNTARQFHRADLENSSQQIFIATLVHHCAQQNFSVVYLLQHCTLQFFKLQLTVCFCLGQFF